MSGGWRHHPGSGLAALLVVASGISGVVVSWFLHELRYAGVECDGAVGACSSLDQPFAPWAVGGAAIGVLLGVLAVVALARSLRD
jgi:hypothetical protein